MSLQLRPYQAGILDALRNGFASGKRSQILYAPTGAGKTEMAIELLRATKVKGNKAAMLLDRIVLCDQTSKRLEKYSIDHGVMQSGHWRFRPYEHIQVCSAQTLEKRGSFPGLNLLIVDECHQTREQTIEFIKNNPDVKVIGLTATPFTKGLGKVYENVVSTITTKDLVEQKVLVPLRVFIAKEINMDGAKKVAGEWSQAEASKRGMQITGDVVAEWIKMTHEIFGRPRKTIVFCSGVDHGNDLSRKFAESGYNFVAISYRDDDEFKKDVIAEFAKPDTEIHGLIATDILTKGFDVPDVMIGVSARPFSKSLSSHIQQMGRVMRSNQDDPDGKTFALWLCLAKGSLVLTDKGLVPIDKVTLSHKIWDGTNFVTHGGAVCNGIQKVITYQGLTATPGHLVHTAQGWRTFGDCAREQIAITQTGLGGQAIRLREDHQPRCVVARREDSTIRACGLRVREVWQSVCDFVVQLGGRANQGLQAMQSAGAVIPHVALRTGAVDAGALSQSEGRQLSALWGAGRGIPFRGREGRNAVDHEQLRRPAESRGYAFGSHQAGGSLRAGQHPLADGSAQPVEQARQSGGGANAQVPVRAPGNLLLGQHAQKAVLEWNDGRPSHRKIPSTFIETEREVWDILDAGPNNRFTCEGLLVHNCHSGNYLRFREEWEDVYENGVHELDEGKEKPKKEPTEKEKKEAKCPKCDAYMPKYMDTCAHCGYVREKRSLVQDVPGEMSELQTMSRENKQAWWSGLQWYVHAMGKSPGWAAHTYKDKFGVWPRNLSDAPATPPDEVVKFVEKKKRAYIRMMKKGMKL
jgi:superfamily II DNA or RNA helicase